LVYEGFIYADLNISFLFPKEPFTAFYKQTGRFGCTVDLETAAAKTTRRTHFSVYRNP
jgi:hypothetical protein